MCEDTSRKACIYISWYEAGQKHETGPFWTLSPDGTGIVIQQNWIAYNVQYPDGRFERVTVPAIHSIYTK